MYKIKELISLAQRGDENAKKQLIEENTGLVWSIVKRFANRGYEAEDLFQLGLIGLIKCIDKFDFSFNVKFSTYAVPMIMGEIKRFLRDDGPIKISRKMKELAVKAKMLEEAITKKTGKSPTVNYIAEQLDTTVEELVAALDSSREVESIYSTVYQNDGNPVYLIDKLTEKENSDEKMIDNILLRQLIENLPKREKEIIKLRYFEDKTQTEVAKKIGISQVQVSRIEKRLLAFFRGELKAMPRN